MQIHKNFHGCMGMRIKLLNSKMHVRTSRTSSITYKRTYVRTCLRTYVLTYVRTCAIRTINYKCSQRHAAVPSYVAQGKATLHITITVSNTSQFRELNRSHKDTGSTKYQGTYEYFCDNVVYPVIWMGIFASTRHYVRCYNLMMRTSGRVCVNA